jgi:hydrogenase nickel incorporation protein HypA/HybF
MHELAITQSIIEAVAEAAGNSPVTRVQLEIGTLAGVVIDSIRFCFDVCTQSTVLEGAALQINEIAGRAHCLECNVEFALETPVAICACGGSSVQIVAGNELMIKEVEIRNV